MSLKISFTVKEKMTNIYDETSVIILLYIIILNIYGKNTNLKSFHPCPKKMTITV